MVGLNKNTEAIELLYKLSEIINDGGDVRNILHTILEMLSTYLGMQRGTITLLNRAKNEIYIEEAYEMTNEEKLRGKYSLGEGIVGKVVEAGMPVVVPKISEEPQFLNRTKARDAYNHNEIAFLCVPIKFEGEIIGTLSVDRAYSVSSDYEEDLRFIKIIASMIAQNLRLRQEEREETSKWDKDEGLSRHNMEEGHFRPKNMVGSSAAMLDVYKLVAKVAPAQTTVLITGESGVGKEFVANAIHESGTRPHKPYIKVNCSALPESLIESELFGHERGAFTGADRQKKGRFELANGGTILLDEIGELPLSTQVKLLRILQEKEFERIGGVETIKVDIRVIAATNKNLEKLVNGGAFREDLYYRLNVFPIHIPPLRDRKSDITLLTDHFIEKYNKINGRNIKRISTSAIDMIMSYHWPGNVRELENCIERASILCTNNVIYGFHLPPTLQTPKATGKPVVGTLISVLSKVEKELIQDTLKLNRGNMARTAEMLGITERMMGIRVQKHQIDPKKYKTP